MIGFQDFVTLYSPSNKELSKVLMFAELASIAGPDTELESQPHQFVPTESEVELLWVPFTHFPTLWTQEYLLQ